MSTNFGTRVLYHFTPNDSNAVFTLNSRPALRDHSAALSWALRISLRNLRPAQPHPNFPPHQLHNSRDQFE